MFFDWYQGTIFDDNKNVLNVLSKLGNEVRSNNGIAKMYRYDQGFQVHSEKGIVATVLIGGNGDYPHAFATSDNARSFADVVREEWPDKHRVTRVDVAQDFHEAGSYGRLRKVCKTVAKNHRLKFAQQADELNPCAGRTQYMGSPTSEYRCRLYEKGYQVVAQIPEVSKGQLNPDDITIYLDDDGLRVKPSDWTRLEVQARPKYEDGKLLVATLSPDQVWAMSPWTMELAKKALSLDLERVYIRTKRQSTDDKAFRAMCTQYKNILERYRLNLGDWQSVGLTIGDILKEIKKNAGNYH